MAQILHERLRGRLRLLLLVLRAAGFVFEHPDNPENLIEVTPETFESAMARTRQDYELSHGKQPNARMEGMSAKEGFHKNVMANNDTCDPNGKGMNKWTQSFCWCTNKSRACWAQPTGPAATS